MEPIWPGTGPLPLQNRRSFRVRNMQRTPCNRPPLKSHRHRQALSVYSLLTECSRMRGCGCSLLYCSVCARMYMHARCNRILPSSHCCSTRWLENLIVGIQKRPPKPASSPDKLVRALDRPHS